MFLMMIKAATPSSTQPKTRLTARDFIRSAIRREPIWLPVSTAITQATQTPHRGRAAVARWEIKLEIPEQVTIEA